MRIEEIVVAGLETEATITVDTWGVPHIRAESNDDLFFAQGFNAARDRLWQLDIWRKRGHGLLAADFGPGYLEQDRAARLFLYRGDMAAEWAAYSPDAEAICGRFVAGINAYIDLCAREPGRLPPEFGAMGTTPQKWQAADVVRVRSHSLMRNALSEVIRSNILAETDPAIDTLRQNLEPSHDPRAGFAGPVEALPIDCLDMFKLALAPVTFSQDRLDAGFGDAAKWRQVTPLGTVVQQAAGEGSNNWVVHGSRTDTGRPILANDPHRAHAVPALRYVVHLSSPEFDGIGAGEPALPGICIGHNGTSAFGLTLFFGHDQEDVYRHETHPDDPDLYRYGDGWERMRTVEEPAEVAGHGETTLVMKFTRHGPIVAEYPERHLAVAIRSVWFEPGASPYLRAIATMRAKSFDTFRELMAGWAVPSTNQVYADTTGDTGWVVAGYSPVRTNWDGLLPVAGDGRFEWQGFLDHLPWKLNPSEGFMATANEMNLPAEWPQAEEPIGYEWMEPSRANRIAHVFADETVHSVANSMALQTDIVSMPAKRLCALIAPLAGQTADEIAALHMLRVWDHHLGPESGPAALFEVWWTRHLRPALLERIVPDPRLRALFGVGDPAGVLNWLEAYPAATSERDALLLESLGKAYAECRGLMGEPEGWAWGMIHKAVFEHAVGAVKPDIKSTLDVGPLDIGGSDSSPMNMSYRPGDFRLTIGASFRVVVDVGDWDNSVFINTPGQSGDPRSPHYGDLAPIWAASGYHPLLYSAEAIAAAAETKIVLRPESH